MPLKPQQGSRQFGSINSEKKGGTPQEFATILAREAIRLKLNPKIGYQQLVAQALGTIEAEGGFDGSMWGGDGTHIGPFAMEPSYGTTAQRTNKVSASRIALEHWKSDGETWVPGWWKWEEGETEGNGGARAGKFMGIAKQGIDTVLQGELDKAVGSLGGGGPLGIAEDAIGGVIGAGEDVVGAAKSAEEFLQEMAETLLDFRKLGQLAVEAFSWFLRLIIKAIWDYVIAPIFHWTERAVIWYSENFFGTGIEQGSGFGSQLRANAGMITIAFWAIGYGVLFTDGESFSPGAANQSMAGRAVKGVEGKIARRNLIKPEKVKEETPDKPKAKASTIQIERAQTFSVGRKRPVSVTSNGSEVTGRSNSNGSNNGRGPTPAPVPRPQKVEQQIVLPPGVERPAVEQSQKQTKATAKLTAKPSRTGVGPRGNSGNRPKAVARAS